MGRAADLTGKVFGRWTVVRRLESAKRRVGDNGVRSRYDVRCACGFEREHWGEDLSAGLTTGCRGQRCQRVAWLLRCMDAAGPSSMVVRGKAVRKGDRVHDLGKLDGQAGQLRRSKVTGAKAKRTTLVVKRGK